MMTRCWPEWVHSQRERDIFVGWLTSRDGNFNIYAEVIIYNCGRGEHLSRKYLEKRCHTELYYDQYAWRWPLPISWHFRYFLQLWDTSYSYTFDSDMLSLYGHINAIFVYLRTWLKSHQSNYWHIWHASCVHPFNKEQLQYKLLTHRQCTRVRVYKTNSKTVLDRKTVSKTGGGVHRKWSSTSTVRGTHSQTHRTAGKAIRIDRMANSNIDNNNRTSNNLIADGQPSAVTAHDSWTTTKPTPKWPAAFVALSSTRGPLIHYQQHQINNMALLAVSIIVVRWAVVPLLLWVTDPHPNLSRPNNGFYAKRQR